MMRRAGTINSIALEAGCSTSTVSRVLSGRKEGFSVRPELEARIFETAKRYDYRPNPFVRALRAKHTKIIAVLSFPYRNLEMVEGTVNFIDEIRKEGYSEAVKYVRHEKREDFKIDFPVDAALFTDVFDKSFLDGVERDLIPYAVVNGLCGEHGVSLVIDEVVGMDLMLDHLSSLGHKAIAYSNDSDSNPLQSHYSVAEREMLYLEGMKARGLNALPNHWCREMPADVFLKEALAAGATAIVCYHHLRVIEIMHAAWAAGIKVPERLSVSCFNDDWTIERFPPPVTCISFPRSEMCVQAAKLLLGAISGQEPLSGKTLKFAGKLVVRQSTAPISL